jgi:ParB/RepB/Spo0J family partition protein
MSETVERTSLDLRYQSYRLRNRAAEARLLASIAERGIQEPLAGVDTPHKRVLLDGFRRYRCASQLGIECVPYVSLGEEEATGIAQLMRVAKPQSLSLLEQAKFVVELLTTHAMSVVDVAELLSRSKAWVSMRRSLLKEISPAVQDILFRGAFPVYAYMVTLRPFMRMNGVSRDDLERFVRALAGERLSVREIELLAHGYFRGPATLRQALEQGNWKWSLQQMQAVPEDPEGCNAVERALLRELEQLLKAMQGVLARCDSARLQTRAFYAQANLLVAGVLSRRESFFNKLEEFYDRSGHASGRVPTASSGDASAGDQPPLAPQPQCRAGDRPAAGKDHAEGAAGQDSH